MGKPLYVVLNNGADMMVLILCLVIVGKLVFVTRNSVNVSLIYTLYIMSI